jgi:hypothetical protein
MIAICSNKYFLPSATDAAGYAGGIDRAYHKRYGELLWSQPRQRAQPRSDRHRPGCVFGYSGSNFHDNAVDTPAANKATNSLSNTDTGVLKK